MKSLKAAAVVAGSLVIAGAAAPAFALNAGDVTGSGVNGVANSLAKGPVQVGQLQKLDALDAKKKGSVLNSVQGSTSRLAGGKALLGGLPLHG
ncbi:hypothetical protein ABZX30_09970 [Streptomyces sp. NPDC004542]|uniref:hypothetical protein n=1 Tax=Streptomyces sp. NPDC004542 TaxID=3154281 RepID=UPI0033A2E6E9